MPQFIPASSEGEVAVIINSTGLMGKVTKELVLTTTDPIEPEKKLLLAGEVLSQIRISPPVLNLLAFESQGGSKEAQLEISFKDSSIMDSASLSPGMPGFSIQEITPLGLTRRFNVRLSTVGGLALPDRDRLILKVGGISRNIPVFVKKMPLVKVEPEVISFGVAREKAMMTREIKIVSGDGITPFQIEELSSDNQVFTPVIETIRPGLEYRALVTFSPALVTGKAFGTISVITSLTEKPYLIKVHATLPPSIG